MTQQVRVVRTLSRASAHPYSFASVSPSPSPTHSTISNFKAANKRLKTILEESGGMERWCPVIICLVVLLALIGYMFTLGKH